jgi:hypothetical protein
MRWVVPFAIALAAPRPTLGEELSASDCGSKYGDSCVRAIATNPATIASGNLVAETVEGDVEGLIDRLQLAGTIVCSHTVKQLSIDSCLTDVNTAIDPIV